MEFSSFLYEKIGNIIIKFLMQIPFNLMSSSRNRALLFTIFNVSLESLELGVCVRNFIVDDIENFLDIPWKYMFSAFGLKVVPALMGLIVLMSILTNDGKIVHVWCVTEILLLVTNTVMITIDSDGLKELLGQNKFAYSAFFIFKVSAIVTMYNYLYDLSKGKFDTIFGFNFGCDLRDPARSSANTYTMTEVVNLHNNIQEGKRLAAGEVKLDINREHECIHKYSLRP